MRAEGSRCGALVQTLVQTLVQARVQTLVQARVQTLVQTMVQTLVLARVQRPHMPLSCLARPRGRCYLTGRSTSARRHT